MKKSLLLLLFPFFITSCLFRQGGKDETVEKVVLTHTFLHEDTSIIGIPVVLGKDFMVLSRYSYSLVFEFCRLSGDSLLKLGEFAGIGNGPMEFNPPVDCFFSPETSKLYISSKGYGKMFAISHPASENFSRKDNWEQLRLQLPDVGYFRGGMFSCAAVNDSMFVAVGGESVGNVKEAYQGYENMLSLLQTQKSMLPVGGLTFPDSGEVKQPIYLKRQVYNEMQLLKRPFENRFALVGATGDCFLLFNLVDGQAKDIHVVRDKYPRYKAAPDNLNSTFDKSQKNGYKVAATARYIYLLESPFPSLEEWMRAPDYKGYPNYARDAVKVYDWDGNLIVAYQLDIPINTMFVDEEDCWLYGTTLDFEHESEGIVRFKLPDSTTK